jgi:hypothetical protein
MSPVGTNVETVMDAEVKAMADVVAALQGLDDEAVARVLKWALQRYKISANGILSKESTAQAGEDEGAETGISSFENFHDLFDAANPASAPEKALVAAYWFQVLAGQEDFDSQQLNKELKNLGHPSTNITRDLDALIGRSPRQVIQVRKEGKTKQARKRYKVTREGVKAVEKMLKPADE